MAHAEKTEGSEIANRSMDPAIQRALVLKPKDLTEHARWCGPSIFLSPSHLGLSTCHDRKTAPLIAFS